MASPNQNPRVSSPENDRQTDILPTEIESGEEKAPATDFGPAPDGGLKAWSVVAGSFCAVFASFGWINCTFIISPKNPTNTHRHWHIPRLLCSKPIANLLIKQYRLDSLRGILHDVLLGKSSPSRNAAASSHYLQGPVVGKMSDELGPRIPILLGSFLHVFGLMMTSISKEYYQILLSQSFCSAIGCSFLFYARKP